MENEKMFNDFLEMVKIPSPSKDEKEIYDYLIEKLENMGLEVKTDNASSKVGSNANNIYAVLEGDSEKDGIILSTHMDTVVPAKSQKPLIDGTLIKSDGESVLGGDDKAGIAIVLEIVRRIIDNNIPHGDVEVLVTISEEIGLLGAKYFDVDKFINNKALVFDMNGVDKIGYGSIGQKKYYLEIKGKSSHAAMEPEKGINSIKIAADIISDIETGQLDFETTSNIGIVEGGSETNIVPDYVKISGEIRSHDKNKIDYYINKVIETAWENIKNYEIEIDEKKIFPELDYEIEDCYRPFRLKKDSDLIKNLQKAGENLGRKQELIKNNGGNDGNIFNEKGIKSAVIGIGMQEVHSKNEKIDYKDMKKVVTLIVEYLNIIN